MNKNNMENNQFSNNNFSVETKYNPLKDPSFWIAFVLGGGVALLTLVSKGIFLMPMIPALVALLTWETVIIFRKGKKWSLVYGFIMAVIVSVPAVFLVAQYQSKKTEAEIQQKTDAYMKQLQQQVKTELENQRNAPSTTQSIQGSSSNCQAPYHYLSSLDNTCKWRCNAGTIEDAKSNECICKPGYAEVGKDSLGGRICQEKK